MAVQKEAEANGYLGIAARAANALKGKGGPA
jgi:hypothetical protein